MDQKFSEYVPVLFGLVPVSGNLFSQNLWIVDKI